MKIEKVLEREVENTQQLKSECRQGAETILGSHYCDSCLEYHVADMSTCEDLNVDIS